MWELKNVYKVVHCLHSLSVYLYTNGLSIKMERLKSLNISREDLERTKKMLDDLENSGIKFDDSMIEGDEGESSEDCDTDVRSDKIREYVTSLADPDHCKVDGDKLNSAICGVESKFTITAFDSDGNLLKGCQDKFEVQLQSGSTTFNANVKNNRDGTFEVSYTPQVAGDYVMTISLFDDELGDVVGNITNKNASDGAWKVKITANPVSDLSKCVLKQQRDNAKRVYRAGQVIDDLILESRDSCGNIGLGGEKFAAKLISTVDKSVVFNSNVLDNKNGLYQFIFQIERSGSYELEVTRGDESLSSTRIPVSIHDSGKTDPNNCLFIGLESNLLHLLEDNGSESNKVLSLRKKENIVKLERKAGDVIRFLVQARDQYGNNREVDGTNESTLPQLVSEQLTVIACLESSDSPTIENIDSVLMTPRTAMVAKKLGESGTQSDGVAVDSTIVKIPHMKNDSELSVLLGLEQYAQKFNGSQEMEKKLFETMSKFVSENGHHGLYLVETKLVESGDYSLQCNLLQGDCTSTSTAETDSESKSKPTLYAVGPAHTVHITDNGLTDASQCAIVQSFSKGESVSNTVVVPNSSLKLDLQKDDYENPDNFSDTFKKFHAGREMHIIVQARDKFGNARNIVESDEFLLKLTPKQKSEQSTEVIPVSASSQKFVQGKGLFEIVYTAKIAQSYYMELAYVDKSKLAPEVTEQEKAAAAQLIKSFPQEITVTDAAITDPHNLLFSGTGITNAVQGKESFFVLRMRDEFGNLRHQGGDDVKATLISDARKLESAAEVIDNKDGSYTVKYVAKASGKNRFEIVINGQLVKNNDILDAGVFVSPPNIEDASNVETILDHDLLSALMNAFRVEQKTDNLVEQIQALRQELVKQLRENTKISTDVRDKERKIALLAENKYRAEEIMNQGKSGIIGYFQRRKTMQFGGPLGITSAADAMIKENISLYGNLFYLLQTNPKYLAKCIFLVPASDVDQFLNTVTLTLYGYAFNPREEYLILNLFNETLQLEVKSSTLESFLSGNPILIKLLITYCHERISGKTFLQKVLYDKILDPILEEKDLNLDLNPISLLRDIVSQKEVETGIKSNIDFKEMTYEKAMEADENVRNAINSRKNSLIKICEQILNCIYDNIPELPYGLRFVCRQLRTLLMQKYPNHDDEKKINQVISYVLFFRYLNAPLCTPDGYNLTKKKISPLMRNNLALISKVLLRISTFREFEAVDTHMLMMNEWIRDNIPLFSQKFLTPSLEIVEPEEYLGVNQYAELTQKKNPSITITINEIALTHSLLVKFSGRIIPTGEAADPLSDLLTRFKDKIPEQVETAKNEEITLSLVPFSVNGKAEATDDWLTLSPEQLYEVTKENVRTILRYITPLQLGETVEDTLSKSDSYADEVLKNTENIDNEVAGLTIKRKVEEIRKALPKLDEAQIITKENHYRKLLIDITKEIQNREELQKKQQKEVERLKESLNSLRSYHSFLKDKDVSLDEYVQQTLRNYFKKQEKKKQESSSKSNKVKSYKFSYKDLSEKYKIIHDIQEGSFGTLQKKVIKFTISMNEGEPGVFSVCPTLAGNVITTLQLRLEDLLDKREKGQEHLKIEGVVLNVNMTIHLLNKKFLSKN